MSQNIRDPLSQSLRNLIPAAASDDDLQLRLEVERLQAGRAFVQVMLDGLAACLRELTIKEVVEGAQRLFAVPATYPFSHSPIA